MTAEDDNKIPALFATIHFRSDQRPDGYTDAQIAWMNVIANKHIPDLHADLLKQYRQQFGNPPEDDNERCSE